jgi:uncharacterized membrane protein YbjE (DUF340 family)
MKAVASQSTCESKKSLHRRNNTLIAMSTIGGLAAGMALSGGIGAGIAAISSANAWLAFVGAGVTNAASAVVPVLGAAYGAVTNYSALNWDVKKIEDSNAPKAPAKPAAPAAAPQ